MALKARDAIHQKQIKAGTLGRKRGHKFEFLLTEAINNCDPSTIELISDNSTHLFCGNPAILLLQYIAKTKKAKILEVHAWWLGGLATSGDGDVIQDDNGKPVTKCKSN